MPMSVIMAACLHLIVAFSSSFKSNLFIKCVKPQLAEALALCDWNN